jgi:hypothetical protein
MKTEIRTITPEEAAILLEGNTGNRPIRASRVAMLGEAITRGEWMLTHQGIAIADSGRILDGQHRLLAIIKSGIAVQLAASTGVDESAFSAIDVHDKRTNADALQMPRSLVESARFILEQLNYKPTIGQIREVAEEIADDHAALTGFCGSNQKIVTAVSFRVAALVYIRKGGACKEYALQSYRRLATSDTGNFKPVEHSIFKQLLIGKLVISGGSSRFANFCRALTVFNIENANLSRVYIRDDRTEYTDALRSLIPGFLGGLSDEH